MVWIISLFTRRGHLSGTGGGCGDDGDGDYGGEDDGADDGDGDDGDVDDGDGGEDVDDDGDDGDDDEDGDDRDTPVSDSINTRYNAQSDGQANDVKVEDDTGALPMDT